MSFWNKKLLFSFGVALGIACSTPGMAQDYPHKPIRVIVSGAAGGLMDALARLVSTEMSKELGQTILVENRPGASGQLGARTVMAEAADGHTLLVMSNTSIVDAAVKKDSGIDLLADFAPVGMIASSPFFIVSGPGVKAKTLPELIELAKKEPGQISYASSGVGSIAHFAGEYLAMVSGVSFLHVPFKGGPEQTLAVLAGDIDFSFKAPALVAPMIEGGKATILASATKERYSRFPDVPTVAESGYPDYVVDLYYAVLAKRGTPEPVLEKLNTALNNALDLPNVKAELEKQFVITGAGTPENLWSRIEGDVKIMGEVATKAGMK